MADRSVKRQRVSDWQAEARRAREQTEAWNHKLTRLWQVPEGFTGSNCDLGTEFQEAMQRADPGWCREHCGAIIGTPCQFHLQDMGVDPKTLEPIAKGRPE